ncbi:hypothetical protein BKA62DRAFT_696656 [Auriculariales sp. MPI-PUGE-AT-0066]|nr:hypothetical protein BKA62DRAFT_696656 [Auriculariales sp. MPI-PUGE-AT-0066]
MQRFVNKWREAADAAMRADLAAGYVSERQYSMAAKIAETVDIPGTARTQIVLGIAAPILMYSVLRWRRKRFRLALSLTGGFLVPSTYMFTKSWLSKRRLRAEGVHGAEGDALVAFAMLGTSRGFAEMQSPGSLSLDLSEPRDEAQVIVDSNSLPLTPEEQAKQKAKAEAVLRVRTQAQKVWDALRSAEEAHQRGDPQADGSFFNLGSPAAGNSTIQTRDTTWAGPSNEPKPQKKKKPASVNLLVGEENRGQDGLEKERKEWEELMAKERALAEGKRRRE